VIDLGPEGGERGGHLIAQGTPEEVAKSSKSYTGHYLARLLVTKPVARQRARAALTSSAS
jgi:excinuclease ABC subunit A